MRHKDRGPSEPSRTMSLRFEAPVHLPPLGDGGVDPIRGACVTVVGLGAVGTVAAEQLVRRGVPEITLVDRDLVEPRNLERPSVYDERDIGDPKAVAAEVRLQAMRRHVRIAAWSKDVHAETVLPLVNDADVVVDGTDNLATRYVLNEACIRGGIPLIYGGAVGDVGMVSSLRPPEAPCFRCLLPPSSHTNPIGPCATGHAQVATRVGNLLAAHTLHFLHAGAVVQGLHILRDGEPGVERLKVNPRPGCPACRKSEPEFLIRKKEPTVVQLCGKETVSVDPGRKTEVPLEHLAARLGRIARVRLTPYLVSFEVPPYGLSIFPDGRAIIRGVGSPEVAQTLYHRYVGL